MKTDAMHAYEIFVRMIVEDRIYLDRRVSFPLICRWIGADRDELDALVREELGFSGRALLRYYRASEPRRLMSKYGI
ncbi:MAG: hypothetical protein IJ795_06770 [Bacteroidales bacterium]|nr:hypothetical protein [Bacteroidales bacterium]